MSRITPLLDRFYTLARAARLDHPLGGAAALDNRHYNDGHHNDTDEESVVLMRAFGDETAARWDIHITNGGSLKKLGLFKEDQLTERRVTDRASREYAKKSFKP